MTLRAETLSSRLEIKDLSLLTLTVPKLLYKNNHKITRFIVDSDFIHIYREQINLNWKRAITYKRIVSNNT
jgi:hypothetical protein